MMVLASVRFYKPVRLWILYYSKVNIFGSLLCRLITFGCTQGFGTVSRLEGYGVEQEVKGLGVADVASIASIIEVNCSVPRF